MSVGLKLAPSQVSICNNRTSPPCIPPRTVLCPMPATKLVHQLPTIATQVRTTTPDATLRFQTIPTRTDMDSIPKAADIMRWRKQRKTASGSGSGPDLTITYRVKSSIPSLVVSSPLGQPGVPRQPIFPWETIATTTRILTRISWCLTSLFV